MTSIKEILNKGINILKGIKLNQKLFTFFFFLFLSIIFWFLNALNKEYVANISIPLKFTNLPEDKMVLGETPKMLAAQVAAYGYTFLDYKTATQNPVIVNLKFHTIHKVSGHKNRYYLLSNVLKPEISSNLGENIEIKNIIPDSLIFKFDEIVKKKVPIKSKIKIKLEKQFMLKDSIKFFPDSIIIKGLKSNLVKINEVYTEAKEIKNVNDSIKIKIKLKKIPDVIFQKDEIICKAFAEEYTEMNLEIPIQILHLPDNLNMKLFPSFVKVAFNVGFSNYERIFTQQFIFSVDYSDLNLENEDKINVKLDKSPKEVYLIRFNPHKVDYIIEKK
ncbi:MAG: hypothetical protein JXR51_07915 [Bacteroidales bacterium]|nr:hypothetical protein [Bacteroidales bacterium]MBN2757086.1 hypothetical protein [Bacteroidales bacterium]